MILGPIPSAPTGAGFALHQPGLQPGRLLSGPGRRWPPIRAARTGSRLDFNSYGFVDFSATSALPFRLRASLCCWSRLLPDARFNPSPFGLLILGMKENETRVRFLGYNTLVLQAGSPLSSRSSVPACRHADASSTTGMPTPALSTPPGTWKSSSRPSWAGPATGSGAVVGGTAYMVISNYLASYILRWEMFLGAALLIIAFRFRKNDAEVFREAMTTEYIK